MENRYKFYFSKLLKYFGQGLLFVAPLGLTIFILFWIFNKLDSMFEIGIPGLGLLILFVGVVIIGFLGPILLTNPMFSYFDKLINKTPIVKIIYTSVRDFLQAFVGNKKKFTEPVLIKLSKDTEVEQMGFLTQKDLGFLGIEGNKVSVYIPFSYSIMGTVYIVPSENVRHINASPTDAMKFIISGGVTQSNEGEDAKSTDS